MGANAKKVEKYTLDDWREVVCQIQNLIKWQWTVEERCPTCRVRLVADLPRIMAEKGKTWSLWGETIPCKVVTCAGRMAYFGQAPHWGGAVELTGPPGILSLQHEQAREKEAAARRRASAKGPDSAGLPAWC
ncbi:MAG: hypothetical protein Q7T61_00565 [Caulobacter sp.]|nr:hypothetical protein [Caulobacter sp.]